MEQTDFKKSFLIKLGVVVDWIRLFARLIVLERRNVFPAVAVRALLEPLTDFDEVETFILSQKDFPQKVRTQRQIARKVGIFQRFVNCIVKKDLRFDMHERT